MQISHAEHSIEAILFASGEPVEIQKICTVLDLDEKTVKNLVERVREKYDEHGSAFDIVFLNDCYQMCTKPDYADIIREALTLKRDGALSQAALEVLAIIAYNQPVTRSFVEQVRGVDCSTIMRSLNEKVLIEEAGRLPIPGKPIAYKTTTNFLRSFSLESLDDLPELPDIEDIAEEDTDIDEQLEGQIEF